MKSNARDNWTCLTFTNLTNASGYISLGNTLDGKDCGISYHRGDASQETDKIFLKYGSRWLDLYDQKVWAHNGYLKNALTEEKELRYISDHAINRAHTAGWQTDWLEDHFQSLKQNSLENLINTLNSREE